MNTFTRPRGCLPSPLTSKVAGETTRRGCTVSTSGTLRGPECSTSDDSTTTSSSETGGVDRRSGTRVSSGPILQRPVTVRCRPFRDQRFCLFLYLILMWVKLLLCFVVDERVRGGTPCPVSPSEGPGFTRDSGEEWDCTTRMSSVPSPRLSTLSESRWTGFCSSCRVLRRTLLQP